MPSLRDVSICKLATVDGVDMKTAGTTTLYAVPAGKTLIVFAVVVRNNSASLAGGTDYDFGAWRTAIDLSGMTVAGDYRFLLSSDNTSVTPVSGPADFEITVNTGSTGTATASIDVFGFLA